MGKTKLGLIFKKAALLTITALYLFFGINTLAEESTKVTFQINYYGLKHNAQNKWEMVPLQGDFELLLGDEKIGKVSAGLQGQSFSVNKDNIGKEIRFIFLETENKSYVFDDSVHYEWTGEDNLSLNLWAYAKQGLFSIESYIDELRFGLDSSFEIFDMQGNSRLRFDLLDGEYTDRSNMLPIGNYVLKQIKAPEGTRNLDDIPFEIIPYKNEESINNIIVNYQWSLSENNNEPLTTLDSDHIVKETLEKTPEGFTLRLEATTNTDNISMGVTLPHGNRVDYEATLKAIENVGGQLLALYQQADQEFAVLSFKDGIKANETLNISFVLLEKGMLNTVDVYYEQTDKANTVINQSSFMDMALSKTAGNYLVKHIYLEQVNVEDNTIIQDTLSKGQEEKVKSSWFTWQSLSSQQSPRFLLLPQNTQLSGEPLSDTPYYLSEDDSPTRDSLWMKADQVNDWQNIKSIAVTNPNTVISYELTQTDGDTFSFSVYDATGETQAIVLESKTPSANLFGRLYHDQNQNGQQDATENGIEGKNVFVQYKNDPVWHVSHTDEKGDFFFFQDDNQQLEQLFVELPLYATSSVVAENEAGLHKMLDIKAEQNINIPVVTKGSLHIQVVENGLPAMMDGIDIVLSKDKQIIAQNSISEKGNVLFEGLEDGEYTFTATLSEGRQKEGFLSLNDSQTIMIEEIITVSKGKQVKTEVPFTSFVSLKMVVKGEITDEMEINLYLEEKLMQKIQPQNGTALVTGLCPGEYHFEITLPPTAVLEKVNGQQVHKKENHTFTAELKEKNEELAFETIAAGNLLIEQISGFKEDSLLEGKITGEETREFSFKGTDEKKEIANLIPGKYIFELLLPDYIIQDGYENDAWQLEKGKIAVPITIESGKTAQLPALNLQAYGEITGTIWDDMNEDGIKGDQELLLPQVSLHLEKKEEGKEIYSMVYSGETDEHGAFSFEQLLPGTYRLMIDLPEESRVTSHTGDTKRQQFMFADFELQNGQRKELEPIGIAVPSGVEVFAFWDSNLDGQKGVYERPIPNTLVEISNEKGNVIVSAATNQEGKAVFKEILPGKYQAHFELPQGYWLSPQGKEGKIVHNSAVQNDSNKASSDIFTVTQGKATLLGVGGQETVTFAGALWEDVNGNGIMEDDEPAMKGAEVLLEGQRTGKVYTLYPDEEGKYFVEMRPDTYIITYQGPQGYIFTKQSNEGGKNRSLFTAARENQAQKQLGIKDGEAVIDQNVGWIQESIIEGCAFIDENHNGIKEQDEKILPDVQVVLVRRPSNEVVEKTMSDEKGNFQFRNLRSGKYALQITLPDAKWVFSKTSDMKGEITNQFKGSIGDKTAEKELLVGDSQTLSINVGVLEPALVAGTVFVDENYNGTFDDHEIGLTNVKVYLHDEEGQLIAETKTDGRGIYIFEGLMPQNYFITMDIPQNYTVTKKAEARNANLLSAKDHLQGETEPFELVMGEDKKGLSLGVLQSGEIKGSIFDDTNDNGLWDESETGLSLVDVALYDDGDILIQQTMTNELGEYSFTGILPGSYYIVYTLENGQVLSKLFLEQDLYETTEEQFVKEQPFFMAMAQLEEKAPLGIVRLGSIEGRAFYDTNGNGKADQDEGALQSIKVFYNSQSNADESINININEDGSFILDDLRPDQYTIYVEGLEDNVVLSRESENTLLIGQTGQKQGSKSLEVLAGEKISGYLIGAVKLSAIKGEVWLDQNDNGLKEQSDVPIENISITAIDEATGEATATALTNAQGTYELTGLLPGTYTVSAQIPQGYGEGKTVLGQQGFEQDESGNLVHKQIKVAEDQETFGLSTSMIQYTSIQGTVWTEVNGQKNGLEGALLQLRNIKNDEVISQSMTPITGNFIFAGLRPGEYQIELSLPQEYLFVEKWDPKLSQEGYTSIVEDTQRGISKPITVTMGEEVLDADIGVILPGKIGDKVWLDENKNGLQDSGEPALQGLEVYLYQNNELIATAITDDYGYYLFEQVYPTVSQIKVQKPEQVIPTSINPGLPLLTNALIGYNEDVAYSDEFILTSGEKNFALDLGFALIEEGIYPEQLATPPQQNWYWQH